MDFFSFNHFIYNYYDQFGSNPGYSIFFAGWNQDSRNSHFLFHFHLILNQLFFLNDFDKFIFRNPISGNGNLVYFFIYLCFSLSISHLLYITSFKSDPINNILNILGTSELVPFLIFNKSKN